MGTFGGRRAAVYWAAWLFRASGERYRVLRGA